MLLLIPSNKSEEKEGDSNGPNNSGGNFGSNSTGNSKVIVVLPPDTDLTSKNVLLPDVPKATLEMDNSSGYRHRRHGRTRVSFSQDRLGIFQPTVEPNLPRSRHSSLDQGSDSATFPHSSSSRYHPFNHTSRTMSSRTPRSLRSAFRRSRPDPSLLPTSDLFGIDVLEDSDLYDGELMQSLRERKTSNDFSNSSIATKVTSGYSSSHTSRTTSSTPSLTSGTDKSSPSPIASSIMQSSMRPPLTTSTGSTVSPCLARSIRRKTISKGKLEARSRAHADDDDTESLDGDEDADEEDEMEEVDRRDEDGYRSSHAAQYSGKGDMGIGQRQKRQDGQHRHDARVNLPNDDTLESDLSIILGMASDMELVMPKFDDAYLADLDDNQPGSSWKRASRQYVKGCHAAALQPLNNVEPPCSQSSSSTITSIPTMRSRTASPCVDPSGRSTSLPSPHTALTTSTSQSSPAMMYNSKLEESADKSCDSMISATTISRDIDNLKRHRDSLKEVEEKINESNDNFSATSSTKSSGPIYFKPPTHTLLTNPINNTAAAPLRSLPTMASNGTPPRPAPMIIQSSEWRSANSSGMLPAVGPGGNLIYSIRDAALGNGRDGSVDIPGPTGMVTSGFPVAAGMTSVPNVSFVSTHPLAPLIIVPPPPSSLVAPPSLPQSPPPVTAQQISIATANMTIPSPQELQEEYHYKRDLRRKYYQQLRRTSSMLERSMMGAATPLSPSRRSSGVSASTTPTGLAPLPLVATSTNVNLLQAVSSSGKSTTSNTELPVNISRGALPTGQPPTAFSAPDGLPSHLAPYYLPPSMFRTVADVEAEAEAERRRKEDELKNSFFNIPSPTPSELQQEEMAVPLQLNANEITAKSEAKGADHDGLGIHHHQPQKSQHDVRMENASPPRNSSLSTSTIPKILPQNRGALIHPLAGAPTGNGDGIARENALTSPSEHAESEFSIVTSVENKVSPARVTAPAPSQLAAPSDSIGCSLLLDTSRSFQAPQVHPTHPLLSTSSEGSPGPVMDGYSTATCNQIALQQRLPRSQVPASSSPAAENHPSRIYSTEEQHAQLFHSPLLKPSPPPPPQQQQNVSLLYPFPSSRAVESSADGKGISALHHGPDVIPSPHTQRSLWAAPDETNILPNQGGLAAVEHQEGEKDFSANQADSERR